MYPVRVWLTPGLCQALVLEIRQSTAPYSLPFGIRPAIQPGTEETPALILSGLDESWEISLSSLGHPSWPSHFKWLCY